jgi:L-ascorbate metabolism protein UlaG (beta-lactamase superfamily)
MTLFKYFGQSAFQITTNNGEKILFDPFISNNPLTKQNPDKLDPDYILLSHGHGDHIGDTPTIGKRAKRTVAMVELATYLRNQGLETFGMNLGGAHQFDWGMAKMVEAKHSSAIAGPNGESIYLGLAAGYILEIDEKIIYFAGDTSLFSDMAILIDKEIDYAILPVGGNYTMDAHDAALANNNFIHAKHVIPVHYNTFPLIAVSDEVLKSEIGESLLIVQPDSEIEI